MLEGRLQEDHGSRLTGLPPQRRPFRAGEDAIDCGRTLGESPRGLPQEGRVFLGDRVGSKDLPDRERRGSDVE
jgi:hypothetical protein